MKGITTAEQAAGQQCLYGTRMGLARTAELGLHGTLIRMLQHTEKQSQLPLSVLVLDMLAAILQASESLLTAAEADPTGSDSSTSALLQCHIEVAQTGTALIYRCFCSARTSGSYQHAEHNAAMQAGCDRALSALSATEQLRSAC